MKTFGVVSEALKSCTLRWCSRRRMNMWSGFLFILNLACGIYARRWSLSLSLSPLPISHRKWPDGRGIGNFFLFFWGGGELNAFSSEWRSMDSKSGCSGHRHMGKVFNLSKPSFHSWSVGICGLVAISWYRIHYCNRWWGYIFESMIGTYKCRRRAPFH